MDRRWSVIGLDDDESLVNIDSQEYRLEKKDAAIIHSILCLMDSMAAVGSEINDLRVFMEEK